MLDVACSLAKPGVSTDQIDAIVHDAIVREGAYPAPLNYMGFPKSLCAAVNDVCCHGIPSAAPLRDGDVVSFDVSVFVNGVFGDNCATVIVGKADDQAIDLVETTREALDAAVGAVGPGACLTAVGDAVADVAKGYGIVRQYCGHGIGTTFHAPPFVQHFRNRDKFVLRPGLVFTIEPILMEHPTEIDVDDDQWTVFTRDGARAAQFEHMVLITDHGAEVLTV